MTNRKQHRDWISRIRQRAGSTALTLAVVLVSGLAPAQSPGTFTLLHSFKGSPDSGANPYAGLVRDTEGNFYSTTYRGGTSNFGTVFKLDSAGAETDLYSFSGGKDGGYPYSGLVRDAAGDLYGTTNYGGSSREGTVFKVDTSRGETVLYSFGSCDTDGCAPWGGVVLDQAGNLYGTTIEGDGADGRGTVFKLDAGGSETLLHKFVGYPSDGAYPFYTNVLMDAKGNLYGITEQGGASNEGMVYKLSATGKLTVLHNFTGGKKDGCYPNGTPAMDKNGNLYGTTEQCGSSRRGIVWKVSPKGAETVLHNFAGATKDGAGPRAGVIMDTKGNLYGNTYGGGASGLGTVYELNETGKLTLLHSFAGYPSDGSNPIGGLIRDTKGDLYGTTLRGGGVGYGTVWSLTP
jgi:uncharacterized repeat protein (TIGR03803 family)